MARKKVIHSKDMQHAWRWNDDDLAGRTVALAELTRSVILGDVPALGYNALEATQGFLEAVGRKGISVADAAAYYYGVDQSEIDKRAKNGDEFGLYLKRMQAGENMKTLARVAAVEDKLYTAALGESPQDRKLFLQAHKPDKYDPAKRVKLTVEDLREAVSGASEEELLGLIAGTDPSAS